MNWNRSITLGLAAPTCAFCFGRGLRSGRRSSASPCPCVLRQIFRVCYARFRHCHDKERNLSAVSLTKVAGAKHGISYGRKDEEFIADFLILAKRHLDPMELRVFKAHFLLDADWKLCCQKLNLEKGALFHYVYRVMQRLGQAFRETKPYPLFPLEDYYDSMQVIDAPKVLSRDWFQKTKRPAFRPVSPPLRQAA